MKTNPTALEVVAVRLVLSDGRVLMQKRAPGGRHGGLWEFPGGKVEANEAHGTALVRELAEELGISVTERDLTLLAMAEEAEAGSEPGRRPLVLFLYSCSTWEGEPRCLEGEAIAWLDPAELRALAMPPLDLALLAKLDEAASG